MGKKKNVLLYMDEEIVEKAKKMGLNLSQFCENALKEAIERLSSPKTETNGGTRLARGVGFEPTRPLLTTGLAGLPPTRLGQPRNYPLT